MWCWRPDRVTCLGQPAHRTRTSRRYFTMQPGNCLPCWSLLFHGLDAITISWMVLHTHAYTLGLVRYCQRTKTNYTDLDAGNLFCYSHITILYSLSTAVYLMQPIFSISEYVNLYSFYQHKLKIKAYDMINLRPVEELFNGSTLLMYIHVFSILMTI